MSDVTPDKLTATIQPKGKYRTFFKLSALVLLMGMGIAACLLIGTMVVGQQAAIGAVTNALANSRPYIIALHFALIAVIALCWDNVIAFAASRGWMPPRQAVRLKHARNRLVMMLIVMELVLVVAPG